MTMNLEGKTVHAFTTIQLASILFVCRKTLFNWEKRNKITPPSRDSRNNRYYDEDVVRSILAYMRQVMLGNPGYPKGLTHMYPYIASLDLESNKITVNNLILTKD